MGERWVRGYQSPGDECRPLYTRDLAEVQRTRVLCGSKNEREMIRFNCCASMRLVHWVVVESCISAIGPLTSSCSSPAFMYNSTSLEPYCHLPDSYLIVRLIWVLSCKYTRSSIFPDSSIYTGLNLVFTSDVVSNAEVSFPLYSLHLFLTHMYL
jgi:hypothetical protein